MEVSTRHEEERTKNIAYTLEDWATIEGELLRLSKETRGERYDIRPGAQYFRHLFKTLMQVLCDSGMRPQEATNLLEWKDISPINQGKTREEQALSGACVLRIRNPRGKGSRDSVCDAGSYLKLWKIYVVDWRNRHGYRKSTVNDLVFGNPGTDKPYPYSQFYAYWRRSYITWGLKVRVIRCAAAEGLPLRDCWLPAVHPT